MPQKPSGKCLREDSRSSGSDAPGGSLEEEEKGPLSGFGTRAASVAWQGGEPDW